MFFFNIFFSWFCCLYVCPAYIIYIEQDLDFGLETLLEVFPQYRGEAPSCAEGSVNALHIVLLSNPLEEEVRGTVIALCDFHVSLQPMAEVSATLRAVRP